jgi:hypothetical protein
MFVVSQGGLLKVNVTRTCDFINYTSVSGLFGIETLFHTNKHSNKSLLCSVYFESLHNRV